MADKTKNEMAVPDYQQPFDGSKRAVAISRVAPKSKKSTENSSMNTDDREIFCWRVGAGLEIWS